MALVMKVVYLIVFLAAMPSGLFDQPPGGDDMAGQDTKNNPASDHLPLSPQGQGFAGGSSADTGNRAPEIEDNGRKPLTGDSDFISKQSSTITNCTSEGNDTTCKEAGGQGVTGYFRRMVSDNKDMLLRTFYVVISITGIIVVYFIIKTVRTRQRQSRTKRYGLLSSRDDRLEMTPLDVDDDEDDMTLFDVNQTK